MSIRNIDVIEQIIYCCDQIDEAVNCFGKDAVVLETSSVYRNAVAMCIIQIGELAALLTDDFRKIYPAMPWQNIKRMRNIAAYNYGSLNTDILHKIIMDRIPALRAYCEQIVHQHAVLEQSALEIQDRGPKLTF